MARYQLCIIIIIIILPIQKTFFHFFFQILPFPAEIQKNNKILLLVSTKPIFCAQGLTNW